MTDSDEQGSYAPVRKGSARSECVQRLPFDISTLSVTGLVQNDDTATPDTFPREAYAEAAQLGGISVDADALRDFPHTVLLSDELAEIYEF